MAIRLWLDRRIELPNASNIGSRFDNSTGFTFYDLNQLQDEYRNEEFSVVEVDFYAASILLPLSDMQVVDRVSCARRLSESLLRR